MKRKVTRIITIIAVLLVAAAGVKGIVKYCEKKAEEKRLSQEPYFTKDKLSAYEMEVLFNKYQVKITPKWREEKWWTEDLDDWPDYSYYTIEAAEDTEIVVTVLNYWLFDEQFEFNKKGWEKAAEYGITTDKRLTVSWVMEHPKEAVKIIKSMDDEGSDYGRVFDFVYPQYEEITGIELDLEQNRTEWLERQRKGEKYWEASRKFQEKLKE